MELVMMEEIPADDIHALPNGRTFKCRLCGTRTREGQPHTAIDPEPHQTFELLTVSHTPEELAAMPSTARVFFS